VDVDVDLIGWVGVRLGILYMSFTRKLSETEDGRYRPKHVVFPC